MNAGVISRTVLEMCSGEAVREANLDIKMSAHRLKGGHDAGMLLCQIQTSVYHLSFGRKTPYNNRSSAQ